MAEDSTVIGDLTNDYETVYPEVVTMHRIVTSKGVEELLIFTIALDDETLTTLRYDGRQIVKVMYTDPQGKTIKQAFYRSTGVHVQGETYTDASNNIVTDKTWVPFNGVGYHDEGSIVSLKRDINKNPWPENLIKWSQRHTMLYKCDYFGAKLALQFGEPVDSKYPITEYNVTNKEYNKNFDLVRYGDETTMRISFLLSSGDHEPPPFWVSPLGRQIIETYGFESVNPNYYGPDDPDSKIVEYESEIMIDPSNYIEADSRQVNNFVADYVSFNWKDEFRSFNYDETFKAIRKRQNREYNVRYGYMPTAKGTWVMFDTYLHTNPDSRLPMEAQSLESRRTKEIYDDYDRLDPNRYLEKLREKEAPPRKRATKK